MGRYYGNTSYGHGVERIGPGHYRLSWTVDRYHKNSRLRFPTGYTKDTDLDGAIRFAKRWKLSTKDLIS